MQSSKLFIFLICIYIWPYTKQYYLAIYYPTINTQICSCNFKYKLIDPLVIEAELLLTLVNQQHFPPPIQKLDKYLLLMPTQPKSQLSFTLLTYM